MSNTRSICFGRFLIDLPEGIQITVAGHNSQFMFAKIDSTDTGIDQADFVARMKQRETELSAGKEKDGFALTATLSPSAESKIFKLSRTYNLFPNRPPSTGLEAYRLSDGRIFSMAQNGFNSTFPQIVERVSTKLLPALRSRQSEEIPTEPGFCIKDGFIADDGSARVFEESKIFLQFEKSPDVWFTVYSQTVAKEGEKALLQRMADNPIPPGMAALISQIKTLRKGKHAVGNLAGEEALDVLPHESGFKVHEFTWEMLGALRDPFKPTLHAEFSTGHIPGSSQRTRPSITDEQAIKLFDSLVNSIRLRPTGPAKVSAAEPPPVLPLGEVVSTGAACPQTGWWRCVESTLPMRGGRKQFFHAGDAMPHALLLAEPTVWQKLKGEQLTHKVSTVWTLVDYEVRPVAVAPAAEATTPAVDDKPAPADES